MSEFSECFARIKQRRNWSVEEIAVLCGKDKTVLWNWFRGKYFPESWEAVQELVWNFNLSPKEYQELYESYQKTKWERKCPYAGRMIELFRVIQKRQEEYSSIVQTGVPVMQKSADIVRIFHTGLEIWGSVIEKLDELAGKEHTNLYLHCGMLHPELMSHLKVFCAKTDCCNIAIILYGNETVPTLQRKWDILEQEMELLIQKNPMQIYLMEGTEQEMEFGQNFILSDDFLIQYDGTLTNGMMTSDKRLVNFFLKHFDMLKENGMALCNSFVDDQQVVGFVKPKYRGEDMTVSCMIHMPSIYIGISPELLDDAVYDGIPGREDIIQLLALSIQMKNVEHLDHGDSVFEEDGLREFMETGLFEMYPRIYRPLTPEERCEVLGRAILLCRERKVKYHMIRANHDNENARNLFSMQKLHLEMTRSGKEVEMLYFGIEDDRNGTIVIYISDAEIRKQFAAFFQFIMESDFTYSEEETIERMRGILEEYENKCRGTEG